MKKTARTALRLALIYGAFGALWIFLSDKFLASIFLDPATLTQFQTYKGWFYVAITFVLLFFLMRHALEVQSAIEDELRESGLRYREVFENTSDGLFLLDVSDDMRFKIVEFNPAEERMIGYSMSEVAGKFIDEVLPDEAARKTNEQYRRCVETGTLINYEEELTLPSGMRFFYTTLVPVRDISGRIYRIIGIARDITERKEAAGRIVHLNRVYSMLSGINALTVRARDRNGLFRETCRIAVEAGGFRMAMIAMVNRSTQTIDPVASAGKDEALLSNIRRLLSSAEDAPKTMVARAINQKQAMVSNNTLNDPQVMIGRKYVESEVRSMAVLPLIVAEEAVGVLALYSTEIDFFQEGEMRLLRELTGDVAFAIDYIANQERLDYLAYYDVLTGLANRSLFLERLEQLMSLAVDGEYQLALLLIDLERFKNINDSLGRPAGDALLKQMAEWLTRNIGDVNLLARMDADHFAIVLPDVSRDGDVARRIENLMASFLEHSFHLDEGIFRIAAKFGVALFPDHGAEADTLFRNAEAALKQAKASGDRYLFYAQAMTESVSGRLSLENQLRQALGKEEFVLHYQPKVDLMSGKVTGAEALIRWSDPRTGLVSPARFMPILEETGLINEVGRWALHRAIQDYLHWRSAGLAAVPVSVNVSPLQLRNNNFIAEIEREIGIDVCASAGLELEITESLIMANVKHSINSLRTIRSMGVKIAIDDFGTGFSSLSYLSKLPVDTLKIDRSFVNDMTAGPEGLALVSTIIKLAHSLDLNVVAEGVETEEQSHLLRLLKCNEMQGFLFSKPVPPETFETRFLASHPAE